MMCSSAVVCVRAARVALSEQTPPIYMVYCLTLKKKFESSLFGWVKLGSVLSMKQLNKLAFLLELCQFLHCK